MTTIHTNLTDLNVGDRVTLLDDVERWPHFIAHKGSMGTVATIEEGRYFWIKMDDHLTDCEEWDNCIVWVLGEDFDCDTVKRVDNPIPESNQDTSENATTHTPVFLHDDGRCTCLDHAGHTLRSEYEANPNAIHFAGTSGTWERVTDAMVREAMELNANDDAFDFYPECETCADADYTYTTPKVVA